MALQVNKFFTRECYDFVQCWHEGGRGGGRVEREGGRGGLGGGGVGRSEGEERGGGGEGEEK